MSILYVTRHGKTDLNIPGFTRPHDSGNTPLNATGKEEARKIGIYFVEKEIKPTIYTGANRRCKETAEIAAKIINTSVFVDPNLDSWDYGNIELEEELRPFQNNWNLVPPDGEPYKAFVVRFKTTLHKYWLRRDPVLLVTHSRNIYWLEYVIDDLPEIPISGEPTGHIMRLETKLKD
jgi:broad specificity phosphatase PhoE